MKPGLSILCGALRYTPRCAPLLITGCSLLLIFAAAADEPREPPQNGGTAGEPAVPPTVPPKNGGLSDLSLEELLQLEVATVTTASKKAEKSTAAPATVLVISDRDIRLRGYATLKDVLRDLPGMEAIENYFSEIGTLVPVRGISGNNKIVVLVNGMRVNPPGGEFLPLRSDFSVRNAEQIEVIYGPGSTLYGQDAISAVINVKTRRAAAQPVGEVGVLAGANSTREAWLGGEARFGRAVDKSADKPSGLPPNSVTAHLFYHDSDLSRLDQKYPAWWADYLAVAAPKGAGAVPSREDYGFNGFVRVEGKDASLQLWQRRSRRSSSEGFAPTLGFLNEARWEDESTVLEGRHRYAFSSKASLDSSLLLNQYEIAPRSRYVFPADANNWFLNDFKYGRGRTLGLEETLRADLGERVSFLAGLVASDSNIIPKSTIPGGAQPGDIEAQGGAFVYFKKDAAGNFVAQAPIRRVVRAQYQGYGGYAEMNWQASSALKATLGARFDKDSRYGSTPFSPRVAAVYDINSKVRVKYIFTRAYVAPAPYFGFATFDNGTVLATSNPNLRPETATSHEVNVSYAKRNLNLGLSFYRGRQSNLILLADRALPQNVIDPEVFVRDANGNFVPRQLVQTVNGGDSRNLGADFYGQTRMGHASLWFSYSYVNFKENTLGMTGGLPGISAHNVRLGGTYAASPKLYFTPSLVWRSTPRNVVGGTLSSELTSPYEVNLHAGYTAGKNTEIFADVRNLTNHKYALGGIAGRAVPQEPFRAQIGVRHSF